MKIFIELPTWLGDSVMATPAIESIINNYPDAKIVFFGSLVSTQLFQEHPNCHKILIDTTKKSKIRFFSLYKITKNLEKFDIAISFRRSFYSKILLKFLKSKKIFIFEDKSEKHQVEKYINFIKNSLKLQETKDKLKLYFNPIKLNKYIGINPGATYGSAKRWESAYFAEVAKELSKNYKILIFGTKNESKICDEIENLLLKDNISCENLAGKTNIKELCELIAGLEIFITNDSGPMHIAATFNVPTFAIFGPTKFTQTSPWKTDNSHILHLKLECMPCMKRTCPIKTHECMKSLTPQMVISEIKKAGF